MDTLTTQEAVIAELKSRYDIDYHERVSIPGMGEDRGAWVTDTLYGRIYFYAKSGCLELLSSTGVTIVVDFLHKAKTPNKALEAVSQALDMFEALGEE